MTSPVSPPSDTAPLTALPKDEQYRILLAASARGDGVDAVCDFGELVFGYVAQPHHRAWIGEHLENPRVGIVSPPESAKTTWMTIITMAWGIGKQPWTTNAIGSAGDDAAEDMAKAVADTIELNPAWKLVFPSVVPDKGRGWSNDGYNVRDTTYSEEQWAQLRAGQKDATLTAGGVGSVRFNGLRVTGRMILDDIHDRKSKDSDTICYQTVAFVKDTAEPRVTETGSLAIIQTRWSPKDVINYAQNLKRPDGTPLYKVFYHPALDAEGESYWPAQWSKERLADTRIKVGEIDFQLIYLGNETAMQGQILKREALHYFPAAAILHTWTHFGGVDFAMKLQELMARQEREHSRYAYAILAQSTVGLVLVELYVALISMGEAENDFFTISNLWRPVRVGLEVNAQNRMYWNNLIRRKIEQGYHWLNVVPVNTSRNMGYRMNEMEPDFRLGAIQISDAAKPGLAEFETEWLGFGIRGVRNDTLSAVHLARQVAYHLLPREGQEEKRAKKGLHQRPHLSTFEAIEKAYA